MLALLCRYSWLFQGQQGLIVGQTQTELVLLMHRLQLLQVQRQMHRLPHQLLLLLVSHHIGLIAQQSSWQILNTVAEKLFVTLLRVDKAICCRFIVYWGIS